MVVANREQTAINIFKRIRTAYEQLPNFLKPGVKEYGKTGLTFDNDSSIGVSTTTTTAVRGESISVLIIDEMGFIENYLIEEFWSSVIPVVSSGKKTKIFAVSTPNGTDNKFYEIYSKAETGQSAWKAERVDWFEDGTSYDINERILNMISNCGMLIGNLTYARPNVYHEIGFIMGRDKAIGQINNNFILILDESVQEEQDKIVGFNLRSIKQIRFDQTELLAEKLKENIVKFYGLKQIN
jgi:hypothetical protein